MLLAGPTHSPSRNISASERFTGLCLNDSHRSFNLAIFFCIFTPGFTNSSTVKTKFFRTEHKTTTWLYVSAEQSVFKENHHKRLAFPCHVNDFGHISHLPAKALQAPPTRVSGEFRTCELVGPSDLMVSTPKLHKSEKNINSVSLSLVVHLCILEGVGTEAYRLIKSLH